MAIKLNKKVFTFNVRNGRYDHRSHGALLSNCNVGLTKNQASTGIKIISFAFIGAMLYRLNYKAIHAVLKAVQF